MGELGFSIIVPCHNEATTIGRKLENCLALSFKGPVEVIVVDDHSTDGTLMVATERLREPRGHGNERPVRLLPNRYAPGKTGALQTALEQANGDLYLLTDADILLDLDILEKGAGRFESDPTLGTLCLSPRIGSPNQKTLARYASGYEAFNRWVKRLQSRLDSLPIMHGQAMFLRAALAFVPHAHLPADDVDFAFQARLQGRRVRYAPDLPFYEEIAPDSGRVFQQKARRAKAVMLSFWHYRRILLNPRYGLFGLVCFPLDFFLYFLLAPLALLTFLALGVWAVARYGVAGLGLVLGVGVLVAVTPLRNAALYLFLLLSSEAALLVKRGPRAHWPTNRF